MNEELIKTLKEERSKLYPNGCPIQPRGCAKTYLYLSHFLRYTAYDYVCSVYEHVNTQMTIEEARKDMNDYIVGLMPDW